MPHLSINIKHVFVKSHGKFAKVKIREPDQRIIISQPSARCMDHLRCWPTCPPES